MTKAFVGVFVFAAAAFAQAQSGSIVGTVTDQAGAVVAGARVTLTNTGTSFTRTVTTNESGQYVAYSVPTGNYTVVAEHAGFQKLARSGDTLTAADTLTVDVSLAVGNVTETVEVRESVPLLQSQTSTVSSLVTNQQLVEMPLNGRTFTALLKLSPGAQSADARAAPLTGEWTNSGGAARGIASRWRNLARTNTRLAPSCL